MQEVSGITLVTIGSITPHSHVDEDMSTPSEDPELLLLRAINCYTTDQNLVHSQAFYLYSRSYIVRLRHLIRRYLGSSSAIVLLPHITSGRRWPLPPDEAEAVVFVALGKIARALQASDSSLDSLVRLISRENAVVDLEVRCALTQAAFLFVSFITMLYTANATQPKGILQLHLAQPSYPENRLESEAWKQLACDIDSDVTSLPLHYLLRRFGDFLPPWKDGASHIQSVTRSIIPSSIDFYTLDAVAHIQVEWVDSISLHLEFDERSEILKLFRWPSLCAMLALGRDSKTTVFGHIFPSAFSTVGEGNRDLFERGTSANAATSQPYGPRFFIEMICSYRLLFGKNARARSRFRRLVFTEEQRASFDPLLTSLCGSPWKDEPLYRQINAPKAKNIYSQSDFPYLGNRLLVLQRHVDSLNPSDLRTLYYDRRNVLQFYTFWAVLVVGGISILLSLAQTVLTAVQVGYL